MSYQSKFSEKLYILTDIEMNIIIGSLLGDGSLSKYGRSRNAYFREQCCKEQQQYRAWKLLLLKSLDLKFKEYCTYYKLYSPSNPIYTELYEIFYPNNIKLISESNIKLLTHSIGLACLYMDDGTLIIDSTRRKDGSIHLFPRIAIYTLSFSKEENIILKNHIKSTFNVEFNIKKRPDGGNYVLELNRIEELVKFVNLVIPYVKQIPSMHYKIDLEKRLHNKVAQLLVSNPNRHITIANLHYQSTQYSKDDEKIIFDLKKAGITDKEIAAVLGRTYYSVTDKIRRMRKKGLLI